MKNAGYLYHYSYPQTEEPWAKTVFSQLFTELDFTAYPLTDRDYPLDNWSFLRFKLNILLAESRLADFEKQLKTFAFNDWHLVTWISDRDFDYPQRLALTKRFADCLNGEGKIKDYSQQLAWAFWQGYWYFGTIEYNREAYLDHLYRPHQFSQALPLRFAHQLIHLLALRYPRCRYIDPCAGSGLLVSEGLRAGLDITGYEINETLCDYANENLAYYHLPTVIEKCDMLKTDRRYDICLLDVPYGLYTQPVPQLSEKLIAQACRISDRLLLISTVDYSSYLQELGYQLIFVSQTGKARFRRLIFWAIARQQIITPIPGDF